MAGNNTQPAEYRPDPSLNRARSLLTGLKASPTLSLKFEVEDRHTWRYRASARAASGGKRRRKLTFHVRRHRRYALQTIGVPRVVLLLVRSAMVTDVYDFIRDESPQWL